MEQRTNEWYQARLGLITSSQVGCLIGKGKAAPFTTTGISYLNSVISERMLPAHYVNDPEHFKMYMARVDADNKALRYGTSMEDVAREWYKEQTAVDCLNVIETGFVEHHDIVYWGDSPDGLVIEDGGLLGTIEIKCPFNPANTIKFLTALTGVADKAEALKKVDSDYYWQCVSHCACNGVKWCDFIIYDPMVLGCGWIFRIEPTAEDIELLTQRVVEALEYVGTQLRQLGYEGE